MPGRGPPESPLGRLESVREWLTRHAGEHLESVRPGADVSGHPVLLARLHPAAEDVTFVSAPEGKLVISARTSAVGPGYHHFLCELIRRLGDDAGIYWAPPSEEQGVGDATGYFDSQDFASLQAQMLEWLRGAAIQALELRRAGQDPVAFSLLHSHAHPVSGGALTPLGPRDDDWLRAVKEDPSHGRDVFPWWNREHGAAEKLSSALTRLWTQVVWRPPLLDEERRVFEDTARDLEAAWREDAGLPYPWREWREVLAYLGRSGTLSEEVSRRAAESPPGPEIGYRRGSVQVVLTEGWQIRIPGSLAESQLADGSWVARDHRRRVRFIPLADKQALRSFGPQTHWHEGAQVVSRATVKKADEGEGASLTAVCEAGSRSALCIIQIDDADDEPFALETWRSIDALAQA